MQQRGASGASPCDELFESSLDTIAFGTRSFDDMQFRASGAYSFGLVPRPAGAAFDAIVLGAATFSPSFLAVSCLRSHCPGRIVFASVRELAWSVPLHAIVRKPTSDSWRFPPRRL